MFQQVILSLRAACKVLRTDHSSALYLELGNDVVGYAPSWMVTDETYTSQSVPIKERKKYRIGTHHRARVVQFNSLDGVAIVSLQDSVLDKPYMKYADLKVGMCVEGVVEKVADFGMTVAISESIHGLCPLLHVSDLKSIVSKPERKFKAGGKVKCRVLNVTPTKKHLLLTCKRTLVQLEEEEDAGGRGILCDYSSAIPGKWYTGVVTSLHSYGLIVHFFGHVRGLVLTCELSSSRNISNPLSVFWKGQCVECRVMECDPVKEKLLLSFCVAVYDECVARGGGGQVPTAGKEVEMTLVASSVDGDGGLPETRVDAVPIENASDATLRPPLSCVIESASDATLPQPSSSVTALKVGDTISAL